MNMRRDSFMSGPQEQTVKRGRFVNGRRFGVEARLVDLAGCGGLQRCLVSRCSVVQGSRPKEASARYPGITTPIGMRWL